METTIQVSKELLGTLKAMKMYEKESYENILWDLIEDRMEFSEQTKKNISIAEKDIAEGRVVSLEQIKKELSMSCSQ